VSLVIQLRRNPAVHTETVYVLFTTMDETCAAVRIARPFADAMGAEVTVVHFRTVPFALPVEEPTGTSVETGAFVERLRTDGMTVRFRVYVGRDERRAIPFAFKPHSVIVMGGQHSWWPTRSERWRRALETAGHFVIFVDTPCSSSPLEVVPSPHADEQEEHHA